MKESYRDYLNSSNWRIKRTQKLSRKGGNKRRCAVCANVNNLDVHHLAYRDLYSVNQSDLRILCRRCHDMAHELIKCGKLVYRNDSHASRFQLTKIAVRKALGIPLSCNMFKKLT